MNRMDAKRYVYRVLSETLKADLMNGSLWLEQDPVTVEELSEADQERVLRAVEEVTEELKRRGGTP